MFTKYLESTLKEEDACYVEDVAAGKGWLHLIKKGQIFRILDLKGNQAVDTLFINANDPSERYSVQQTVQRQANCLVGVGTKLYSNDDNAMLTVVADTCGDHDTLGSACSCESNTCRYSLDKRYMHACRESFLKVLLETPKCMFRLTKREISTLLMVFLRRESMWKCVPKWMCSRL